MNRVSNYFAGSRQVKYVLVTLVCLVAADGIISRFLVRYRLGREGNPFMQTLVGQNNFLIIKLSAALLCALILWDLHKTRPSVALWTTLLFVILYTIIVFWNLGIYFATQV